MKRFFAQVLVSTTQVGRKWDEINESMYKGNLADILNTDNSIRYNGNRVCFDDVAGTKKDIEMLCAVPLTQTEMSLISRFCGAQSTNAIAIDGGYIGRPEFLHRKKKGGTIDLLHVPTGEIFRKAKKEQPKDQPAE